jgi:flagellin
MAGIGLTAVSLTAQRTYAANAKSLAGTLEKLATGQRINRGKDDPAGLITSENFRAVLAALDAETRSLQRVDSVANVADAALSEISGLLVEATGLAVSSANTAGVSDAERAANQMELDSIVFAINRIANSTSFNGDRLLDGTATLNAGDGSISISSAAASALGEIDIDGTTHTLIDVASGGSLNIANGDLEGTLQTIRAAMNQVATQRGTIGAFQKNTVTSQISTNQVAFENVAAANSLIRDTDYAKETAALSRAQLLNQSSIGVMSMINFIRQQVMDALMG